jgi:hypothetical protein
VLFAVSIPKLLSLVQPLISSPCYTLLRYATVSPMLGAVRAHYSTAAVPGEIPGAAGAAAAAGGGGGGGGSGSGGFLTWVKAGCRGSANTVFTDQVGLEMALAVLDSATECSTVKRQLVAGAVPTRCSLTRRGRAKSAIDLKQTVMQLVGTCQHGVH